jgi:hypothetical protein
MNLAQIESASTTDLREELTKLKEREKKVKAETQRKTNKMVGSILTVGSAALGGWWMGSKRREVEGSPEWAAATTDEEKQKLLLDKQGFFGIDADLLLGLGAFGLGLSEAADDYSDTFTSIGSGLLASATSRMVEKRFAAPLPVEGA